MTPQTPQHTPVEETLRRLIYEKYIAPTERPKKACAGLEFELPVVNLDKKPVDFSVVHALTDAFLSRFDFSNVLRDDNGDIYNATDPGTGDCLSYDCSFNTLEFSFGIDEDLSDIYDRFCRYYSFIQDFLLPRRHTLTGMGLNPYRHFNNNVPIANGRYRMLLHHLESYPKYPRTILFHDRPNFGLFSCASQVQLDAQKDTLVETLNTFTRLEPVKFLCSRDYFWKHSMHGVNPHNVDIYDKKLTSVDEVVAYIRTMSLYCVERDEKYINFPPTPLETYFRQDHIDGEYYDVYEGRFNKIRFIPEWEDLQHLRSFKFDDVTFRGTIEFGAERTPRQRRLPLRPGVQLPRVAGTAGQTASARLRPGRRPRSAPGRCDRPGRRGPAPPGTGRGEIRAEPLLPCRAPHEPGPGPGRRTGKRRAAGVLY